MGACYCKLKRLELIAEANGDSNRRSRRGCCFVDIDRECAAGNRKSYSLFAGHALIAEPERAGLEFDFAGWPID